MTLSGEVNVSRVGDAMVHAICDSVNRRDIRFSGDLFVKVGCPIPSPPIPTSLPFPLGSHPEPGLGSATVKCFMIHFERKIMPLVTKKQQSTTNLCHNWNSEVYTNKAKVP